MDDQPSFEMQYGLYDTEDGIWFGDDDGPRMYDDYTLARVAAEMVDMQLGQEAGRTRAKEYYAAPMRLRDTVAVELSPLEAYKRLEQGRLN